MNNLDNIIKYNDECVAKFVSLTSLEMKNGIQSIYNDTKEKNTERKKILKEFQQNLSNIPKWSQTVVDNEYNRIKILSKCDYFDDLIQNIFKSYFKVLFLIKKKRENLNIPNPNNVIHHCYISLAREVWKKPVLFYHRLDKKDIQKNHIEINNLIKISIKTAIKDLLPFKEILNNYLDNDDDDSDDDYDDFEQYNLNDENEDINLVSNGPEDFVDEEKMTKTNEDTANNKNIVNKVDDIVEDAEGGIDDDEGGVEDVEGVVNDDEGIVNDDEGIVNDDEGVVNDDEGVVEDVEGIVNDDEGVVEDVEGVVNDDEGVVEDVEGVVNDDEGVVNDDEGVVEDVEGVVNDDEGVVNDDEGVVEVPHKNQVDEKVIDNNVKNIDINNANGTNGEELIDVVEAKVDDEVIKSNKKKSKVKSSKKIERLLGMKISKEELKNNKKLRKKLLMNS